jgi:integrase
MEDHPSGSLKQTHPINGLSSPLKRCSIPTLIPKLGERIFMKLQMAVDQVLPYLRVTNKTRYNYLRSYTRHFSDPLGQRCMNDVSHLEIREIISKLPSQSGYQALMVLRSIYREANTQGLCEVNPTTQIKSPQISVKPGRFLTWDQIKDNDFGKYNDHIRFLALHGLRWGEAVALTQDDIYEGLVHINRSIHGATKSPAGIRTVPYLGNFQQFPVTRKPLAKALKPYEVNIHSLRKSYAYILKSNNIHVTTAQRLLGHASPLLTLSVYTQVLDDEIIKAGQVLLRAVVSPF